VTSGIAPHPLITQLRFARSEFVRGLEGVSEADGLRRLLPMNSIGWMVGHLANQEHRYWVVWAQQRNVAPGLDERVGSGKPASTPPLGEMWAAWQTVTAAADAYLDALTPALLETHLKRDGAPVAQSVGTLLLRNLYHYWFHTGEAAAVRQMLGHPNLPDFVGDMSAVPYRPER
jgi:DinB family protein